MAEPEQGDAAAFIRDAPLRVVLEIVRRLPARSVFSFLKVCKAWRDTTSHPIFLVHLHKLQPRQPLICFDRLARPNRYVQVRDYCVEALNLRSNELRSVFRFTDDAYRVRRYDEGDEAAPIVAPFVFYRDYEVEEYDDTETKPQLSVHGSLDGLLLVSFLNASYVCNPAMRLAVSLPNLNRYNLVGFYEHGSSREYRVLLYTLNADERPPTCYYVLKVGDQMARSIGYPISPAAADMGLYNGLIPAKFSPPVQLHTNLHWPPQARQQYHILVFDTQNELFSWMRPPVIGRDMSLLEMEGKLAMSVSVMNGATLDLCCLQDYQNRIWVLMFRIQLATLARHLNVDYQYWSASVVSPEGDVLILIPHVLIHCDRNGRLLHLFGIPDRAASVRHALKESLLTHAIFLAPEDELPFSSGL